MRFISTLMGLFVTICTVHSGDQNPFVIDVSRPIRHSCCINIPPYLVKIPSLEECLITADKHIGKGEHILSLNYLEPIFRFHTPTYEIHSIYLGIVKELIFLDQVGKLEDKHKKRIRNCCQYMRNNAHLQARDLKKKFSGDMLKFARATYIENMDNHLAEIEISILN